MKNKACMVVFSYYPSDPRVKREGEALIEAGYKLDVICLKEDKELANETVNEVNIHRLNITRKRGGKLRYIWEYASFIFVGFFKLTLMYIGKRYNVVHVHNMPDVLVVTALVPKLFGSKIVLDLHDPTPEVFMTKYELESNHKIIKFLCTLEKYSIQFSDMVLTPNIAFKNLFIKRGCPPGKIHVIMNSPQESVFSPTLMETTNSVQISDRRFVIMYHGTIVERHGLDIALEAIAELKSVIPNISFNVYGSGDSFVEKFQTISQQLGLNDIVTYYGFTPLDSIARAIKRIDLGIIPNKKSPFTEINFPTRIYEYLYYSKPVIVPRTIGIMDYFDEEDLYFFDAGSKASLKATLLKVYNSSPDERQETIKRGIAIYKKYQWQNEKRKYQDLIKKLLTSF